MTLQRVKEGSAYPFLIPLEAKLSGSVTVKFAPRSMSLKNYDGVKEDVTVVDVELSKKLTSDDYDDADLKKSEIEKRIGESIRTWRMNGRSLNHLIDTFGENEEDWVGKKISLEVFNLIIAGEKKKAIYPKGAMKEEDKS